MSSSSIQPQPKQQSQKLQSKSQNSLTVYPYQFNVGVCPNKTINASNSSISIAAMRTLSPEVKRRSVFSIKELEPKNYSSNYLCPSKSNKSISTGVSFSYSDRPSAKSRQQMHMHRQSNSTFDFNKRITTQMVEETRQTINSKLSTVDHAMNYVQTEGFGRYHREIQQRKKRILSIEIKTNEMTSGLKGIRKDENNLMVSNGKLTTEIEVYSQRKKSYQRERVNGNKIRSIKVDLPQYGSRIKKEREMAKERNEEARRLTKETNEMKSKIKTTTICISECQKQNERIREQIHLIHKQKKAIKDKLEFYFDANEKAFNNVYRLVTDKSLYYQDKNGQ